MATTQTTVLGSIEACTNTLTHALWKQGIRLNWIPIESAIEFCQKQYQSFQSNLPTERELFITLTSTQCIIGPMYDPKVRGVCYPCFFFRFLACQTKFTETLAIQDSNPVPLRSLTKEKETKLFQLVEILLGLSDLGSVFCIDDGQVTQQRLLPRADCEFCTLPSDGESNSLGNYINPLCGIIQRTHAHAIPLDDHGTQYFWQTKAYPANHRLRLIWNECGLGKAFDRHSADRGAIAEALERYAQDAPLPEADVSLPMPSWVKMTEFETSTVVVYELSTRQSVRVPRHLIQKSGEEKPYDWSGLAAHTIEEQAIQNGLLEVLERDAFLKAWYEQCTIFPIPTNSSFQTGMALVSFLEKKGCQILFAAIKGLLNTITVMAVALSDNRPRLAIGLGCSTNLHQAQQKALEELIQVYTALEPYMIKEEFSSSLAILEDPTQVQSAFEHGLYYAAHGSKDDLPPTFFNPFSPFEEALLKTSSDLNFNESEISVYYSPLTPPDIRVLGWHVMKVYMPLARQLRFGYSNMQTPKNWIPRTQGSLLHPLC